MMTLLLIVLTICSFLFYGVVGQDKSFLLGPLFVLAYATVSGAMIKKSGQLSAACLKPGGPRTSGNQVSSFQFPVSTLFWLLFLTWGITLIPTAVMPFDAKVRMLFFGAAIGSYMVWGQELTAFKDNRMVLGWLIFIVMLLALYGLVLHIKSPDSILWSVRYTDHYEGRLASTYICPNHFAHLMQMLLPFCIALLFIPQAGLYLKILAGYSSLIFMPPLFLTESRAGWLGAIAGIGVLICLMALRRSKKLFALLVVLVPLCSALLLFGAWRYSETFQRRMTPVVQFMEAQSNGGVGSNSPDFRPLTWLDTIDMIGASAVTGFGPGTFRYAFPEFRKRFKGNQIVTGHPHNEYLELTAEFGLIGLGLFALAWLYGSIWVLIKSLRAAEARHAFIGFAFLGTVAGTMVHSFFDFEMHIFPNAMVFALLAAVSVGPLRRAKQTTKGEREPIARQKGGGRRSEVRGLGSEDRDRRTEVRGQRSENGGRRAEDRGQKDQGLSTKDQGLSTKDQGLSTKDQGLSIKNRGLSTKDPASQAERAAPKALNLKLQTALSWLLTLAFLCATVVGLQTMTSSVYCNLADRKIEYKPVSLDNAVRAEKWYALAVRIDSGNWRAYQGMGKLKQEERRHCLDRVEKVQLAEEELGWYEQAVRNNPKDPESLIGLGRVMIFLSRQQSESGMSDAALAKLEGPRSPSSQLPIPNLEAAGLDLLREACRYRKFNDQYWWFLGIELRKAGHYAEALSVFQQMETVKRTPSSRKNIQWLEKQLASPAEGRAMDPSGSLRMGPSPPNILMNQLETDRETASGTLDDLFQLMEP